MKKKLVSMLLCVVMAVSMAVVPAQAAYTPKYTAEAETLYELGLFRGTGTNADGTPIFSLQNKATRLQALIILIRLLGLEAEALATTEANPFSDIPDTNVGAKYAAYAYSVGLTNGIGGGKFGNGDVTPAQFTTFVLRALGYDDKAGDFKVATAIAKGREIGLLSDDMLTSGGNTLLRDECVKINYNALKTAMKGTDKPLAEKLIDDGVLTEVAVQNSEMFAETVSVPYDAAKHEIPCSGLKQAFPDGTIVNYGGLMLDASFAQADLSPKALLLGSRAIRDYCLGTLDKNSNAHKLTDKGSVPIYAGNYVMAITILDKDLHLVGYCVTPETLTGNAVEFKRCHLDATKEIDALKKKSAEIEKTIPAFDSSAVWCEVFTTSSTTEYNIGLCPAYLQFDRDKLPVSMKDFAYYSCYSGGDTMTLRYAWCHNALSHLVDSKDYSTIIPCGLTKKLHNVHIVNEGIVILYDENKEPIGYTHLTSDMALRENLTQ